MVNHPNRSKHQRLLQKLADLAYDLGTTRGLDGALPHELRVGGDLLKTLQATAAELMALHAPVSQTMLKD
jgi:hypothetical protein